MISVSPTLTDDGHLAARRAQKRYVFVGYLRTKLIHTPNADRDDGLFGGAAGDHVVDRKSTRLNSSHRCISYAVFCLKKKTLVNAVRDEIGRLQRKFLHAPALRRGCDVAPARRSITDAACPRPSLYHPVAVGFFA